MHYNQNDGPSIKNESTTAIDNAIEELTKAKYYLNSYHSQTLVEQDGSETALRRKYLTHIQQLNTRIRQQRKELAHLNYAQHIIKQRNEQLTEELEKARFEGRSLAERYRDVEIEAWQHIAHKYATLQGMHQEQVRLEALAKYTQLKQSVR